MATGLQNHKGVPENLKKQLSLAVRSIQWGYAIFWSVSASQPGFLKWGDGYYNGDIKTRKTIQEVELNTDQIGLHRSEQLKELYKSLSAGETNPQARRPSAALSPEDLTDTEWYYLVCMSFVFKIGQGLPGRTLANGKPIWLCNAHVADTKNFSRSLLAKTVVCFPLLGGVIELGVTDLVLEDASLIQYIKTSFCNDLNPEVIKMSRVTLNTGNEKEVDYGAFNYDAFETNTIAEVGYEDNQPEDDSYMDEGKNGGPSQVQSWQIMDDELSNCIHNSINSSDCISQTFGDPENFASIPKDKKDVCLQDLQESNHKKLASCDLQSDYLHYQSVLSTLLKSPHQLILGPHFQNCHQESSFISWRRGVLLSCQKPRGGTSQKVLKKVLFQDPQRFMGCLQKGQEESDCKDGMRQEADETGMNHVLSERKRREKLSRNFSILKSIVPSISKEDKVSILDDSIEYLKELEKRVKELEDRKQPIDVETRTKQTPKDTAERTSNNYCKSTVNKGKKSLKNKRKASDIDETGFENDYVVPKDGSMNNVRISVNDNEVQVELVCPWREGVLLEIVESLSSLHLDSHSFQSSTFDGVLSLNIKSKIGGSTVTSAVKIKQALQNVAWKHC
ncbi:Basic helix-loop-helix transcription factor [Quillaja saponaria]|uniref:Basic helix-loop-helix transcription factor n=1 Tax=Quillaja saponaria TaxID=32244 RepID=A0AAD7KSN9_QUISA|nr:Basic helix-loop-helix transcription factor [Quillaja saponaria]